MSKCQGIKCELDNICNPETGRCVKKTGAIGKLIMSAHKKSDEKKSSGKKKGDDHESPCKKPCPPEKICNPASRRCVLRSSRVGKAIVAGSRKASPKAKAKVEPKSKSECRKNQRLDHKTGLCVCKNAKLIINPLSKNCVSRVGDIGKKILNGTLCPKGETWDDTTKKCVKTNNKKSIDVANLAAKSSLKRPRDVKFTPNPKNQCILSCATRLTPVQAMSVDYFMSSTDSLLVVFETGMGKTLTALTAGKCFLERNPKSKVVIITQKSLLGTFNKEFEKYGTEPDPRFEAHTYDGMYNSFVKHGKSPISAKDAMVIFDEIHTLRNYESNRFTAAMKLVENASKVLLLTATPFVNTLCDFIPIINLLHKSYVVGPAKKFSKDTVLNNPLYKAPILIPACGKSIKQLMESDGLTKQMDIIENLLVNKVSFAQKKIGKGTEYPGVEIIHEKIAMNPKFEESFLVDVSEKSEIFAQPEKFANGFRRAVNKAGAGAFSDKIKYAVRIVKADAKSNPYSKNLIFSNWIDFGIELVEKALKEADITFETITGDVSAKDRQARVARFNQLDSGLNTLVISLAGSTGIDLRGVQNIIVIDPVWNNAILEQIKGRGVRYKSHIHLPAEKQLVKIYLPQLVESAFAKGETTTSFSGDYMLYEIIKRKEGVEKRIADMIKNVSIAHIHPGFLPEYAERPCAL